MISLRSRIARSLLVAGIAVGLVALSGCASTTSNASSPGGLKTITAGKLTIAELKELGGLPRKQAVLILEYFDQTKVTRRVGETRVLFSAAAKPTERGIL